MYRYPHRCRGAKSLVPPAEVGITIETKFFTTIFAKICVRQEQMRAAAVKLFFFCFCTNFNYFRKFFGKVGDFRKGLVNFANSSKHTKFRIFP
jgi:hypothetical protein